MSKKILTGEEIVRDNENDLNDPKIFAKFFIEACESEEFSLHKLFSHIINLKEINMDLLKWLIKDGFNFNDLDPDTGTPYFYELLSVIGDQPSEEAFNFLSELFASKIIDISLDVKGVIRALINAIISGKLELYKFLISLEGINLNDLDPESGSPYFHELVSIIGWQPSEKAFNILSELFTEKIIDINLGDKDGTTVLMNAIMNGKFELCKFLIAQDGIDTNRENANGTSAISKAFYFCGEQATNTSFSSERYEILKLLVESEKFDLKQVISGSDISTNLSGCFSLILGQEDLDISFLKILIENGFDLTNKDPDGILYYEKLMLTIGSNPSEEAFNFLNELFTGKVIDINHSNMNGTTILMNAIISGHLDLCKFLIAQERIDLNNKTLGGKNTLTKAFYYYDLHLAEASSCNERYEIIKLLLKSENLDINQDLSYGSNSLMSACFDTLNSIIEGSYSDAIKLLIEKGVNVNNAKISSFEDLKILEALCIFALEEQVDCISPYSYLMRYPHPERKISKDTKSFF